MSGFASGEPNLGPQILVSHIPFLFIYSLKIFLK